MDIKVKILKDRENNLMVSFPYNPQFVEKIKTIKEHKWHPEEKYWRFPNSNGKLEKIVEIFEGEKIYIKPSLKSQRNRYVIARDKVPEQSHTENCHSELVSESHSSQSPIYNFEGLSKEIVSRKYSYKTVKAYIYFNRDFLNFIHKSPPEINDDDVKEYLAYLAEERQCAKSTLNQAINAMKFYYGIILKKKFVYELKRPGKDKKLHVALSQEEVARILDSIDNTKHRAILHNLILAALNTPGG